MKRRRYQYGSLTKKNNRKASGGFGFAQGYLGLEATLHLGSSDPCDNLRAGGPFKSRLCD